jgi:hypothetical protein
VVSLGCGACLCLWAAGMGFGAPTAMAAEPTIVKVVMTEYKFIPDHLEFRNGVRYRFLRLGMR